MYLSWSSFFSPSQLSLLHQFLKHCSLDIVDWILPALVNIKNPVLMTRSMESHHNELLKENLSYPERLVSSITSGLINWCNSISAKKSFKSEKEKNSHYSQILRSYSSEKHLHLSVKKIYNLQCESIVDKEIKIAQMKWRKEETENWTPFPHKNTWKMRFFWNKEQVNRLFSRRKEK
jgi:hypothetical protein